MTSTFNGGVAAGVGSTTGVSVSNLYKQSVNGVGTKVQTSILSGLRYAGISNTQAAKLHANFFDANAKRQGKSNRLIGNFVSGTASM